jgi:hypothetical protein
MEQLRNLKNALKVFTASDDGVVTVDYVVILGSIIGFGLLVTGAIASATTNLSGGIAEMLLNTEVSGGNSENGVSDQNSDNEVVGGNPGNDKDVGKAGENPNGRSGWGSGSKGKSG